MKDKLTKALKSRTVWTLVFTFVFNGFAAISGDLPTWAVIMGNGVLGGVAALFKLNPSQKY